MDQVTSMIGSRGSRGSRGARGGKANGGFAGKAASFVSGFMTGGNGAKSKARGRRSRRRR